MNGLFGLSESIMRKNELILMEYNKHKKNPFCEKLNSSNLSLSFNTSMVYVFAKNLPYSIDIEQLEYVPADFLNFMPYDEENRWFKHSDSKTYFSVLVRQSETFKTAMFLQVCFIFQKMLLGEFPSPNDLTEDSFYDFGFDNLTINQFYNRCFFDIICCLSYFYSKIESCNNYLERRKVLEEFYFKIMSKVSQMFTNSFGIVNINPVRDIERFINFDVYYNGVLSLIESIKNEQYKLYVDKCQNKKLCL